MKIKPNLLAQAVKLVAVGALGSMALSAQALQFNPSDDLSINVDTNITWAVQWRVDGRDKAILGGTDKYNYLAAKAAWDNAPLGNLGQEGSIGAGASSPIFKNYVMRLNNDDGSRNFDKWDQTANKVTVMSDIKIQYKNVGLFLRPQIYYDRVPFGKTSWTCKYACDPAMYGNNLNSVVMGTGLNNSIPGGDANSPRHFDKAYKDWGYRARFLDAYAFGNWEVGDGSLEVRLGRQIVNWGEATIMQGGIGTAINPMDSVAATSPGADLKEFYLPSGFLFASWSLNKNLTLEAYWNYDFVRSEIFPTGHFMSMQDMISGNTFVTAADISNIGAPNGDNGTNPSMPGMIKSRHNNPDSKDQWGISGRYAWDNGTEVGVYIVNFHDKYPSFWASNVVGESTGANVFNPKGTFETNYQIGNFYSISHFEDIRLYGLTFNTVIGDTQFAMEYSYRANTPIVPTCSNTSWLNDSCKDRSYKTLRALQPAAMMDFYRNDPALWNMTTFSWPTRAEMHMLNFGITHMFQQNALWDTATLAAEMSTWHIGGFDDNDLQFSWLGSFTKRGFSMGAQFMPEYKNVFEGVDLVVPIFINWTPEGSLSTSAMTEHNLWWSIGLEAVYLDHWRFGMLYNDYSGRNQLWQDRDNFSINVKYTF